MATTPTTTAIPTTPTPTEDITRIIMGGTTSTADGTTTTDIIQTLEDTAEDLAATEDTEASEVSLVAKIVQCSSPMELWIL